VAVIPDIQFLTRYRPELLADVMEWIRDNTKALNIQFVIFVGDLTDTNNITEWERVRDNLGKLDDTVPYAFIPGNHDYTGLPSARDSRFFNMFLPYEKYSQTSHFGGAYESGKLDNAYYYFSAGEEDYMVLCLEMNPRSAVISWANEVTAKSFDRGVIVVTHSYIAYNGNRDFSEDYDTGEDKNNGEYLWENFAGQHENIIMVLCGHIPYEDIFIQSDAGIHGNIVAQLLIDSQNMDYYREGGAGMIALLAFTNRGGDIAVNWYSVKENALFREKNQICFTIAKKEEPAKKKSGLLAVILISAAVLITAEIFLLAVIFARRRHKKSK
jgi:hypothetical protein